MIADVWSKRDFAAAGIVLDASAIMKQAPSSGDPVRSLRRTCANRVAAVAERRRTGASNGRVARSPCALAGVNP